MTAPYQPKPSILDRLSARLFPTAQYAGLLDPQTQQSLGPQGLLNVGTNLLQLGGSAPYQRGTLANIGSAIQGAQMNFPQMAQQALQLQSLRSQQQEQALIAQAGARHPAVPGETRQDAYGRLTAIISDIATVPGGDAIAAKLAPVLAALKPDKLSEPQRVTGIVDTRLGSPTIGQEGDFLIPYPSAPRETWTFIKGAPKEGAIAPAQKRAAVNRLQEVAARLTQLENNSQGTIADIPLQSTLAQGIASTPGLKALAGPGAARFAQSQLSPEQTEYNRLRAEFGMLYLQSVPSATRAIAMQQLTQNTFIPPAGTQPQAYPAFQTARDAAISDIAAGVGARPPTPTTRVKPGAAPRNPFGPGGQFYVAP